MKRKCCKCCKVEPRLFIAEVTIQIVAQDAEDASYKLDKLLKGVRWEGEIK